MIKVKRNFENVDRELIRTLLFTKNITQVEIARRIQETPQSINDHLKGRRTNPKIQAGIARVLGVRVDAIFLKRSRPYRRRGSRESRRVQNH